MTEFVAPQSEDPLPHKREVFGRYDKDLENTLGELVVTDLHDPYVWLNNEPSKPISPPTENGMQLLWQLYRMSGNLPKTEQDIKWRDERDDLDSVVKNLGAVDYVYFQNYADHLARLDAHTLPAALALTAVVQHIKHTRH